MFDERGFPPRADLCLYGYYDKIRRKLRTLVDDLLEEVFTQRIGSMLTLVGNCIVAWEREMPPGFTRKATSALASRTSLFADSLIDATCRMLSATLMLFSPTSIIQWIIIMGVWCR